LKNKHGAAMVARAQKLIAACGHITTSWQGEAIISTGAA